MPAFPALSKARRRLGNGTTSPPQIKMRSQQHFNAASGTFRVYPRGIGRAEPHHFGKGVVLHSWRTSFQVTLGLAKKQISRIPSRWSGL